MKIIFAAIGGIFLVLALFSFAVGFKGGLANGSFHFANVSETISVFIPNGMRSLSDVLPDFTVGFIDFVSRQIAVVFFGIIGGLIVAFAWSTGRK